MRFPIREALAAALLVCGAAFLSLPIGGAILSLLYKGSFDHNPWPLWIGALGFAALLCNIALVYRVALRNSVAGAAWGTVCFGTIGILAVPLGHLLRLNSSSWELDAVLSTAGAVILTWLFRHPPRRRAA